ncbi:hypothetical protein KP509_03G063300 [Ceratopteris richardii]|uniref:Importin N-terminal domain-containing protein n=1 Tax=Ceratopteris richardii TaxID=49495 RepID=A0A8T2V7T4_CERRI|nr:hypothetical protein KP509_03G063300 [Ceratopteris richardii]
MALSSADLSVVYGLLENSLNQDEAIRKPAEGALSVCESKPGFCSLLLEIMASKNINVQDSARWLASVYLKNTINRFWRLRKDTAGISDTEKSYLRSKLLDSMREENNQLALVVCRVARFDYPKDWPDLFATMVQKLQAPDVLLTQRVYMVLDQVLKELSTKRLMADQKNLMQVTSQLFDYAWHHWQEDTQSLLKDFTVILSNPESGLLSFGSKQLLELRSERWFLCLKVLYRMLRFGFPSDEKSVQEVPAVKQVCPHFLQQIQVFLRFRSALPRDHSLRNFLEKSCLKLMKLFVNLQTVHPYTFSDSSILLPVLEFSYRMITEPQIYGDLFDQLLIQSMIFIQTVLQCKAYSISGTGRVVGSSTTDPQEMKAMLGRKAEGIIKSLLDNQRVLLLCDVLVRRYFMLTASDLEEWDRDAEAYYHEQDMVQWKDFLRPCAESLYLVLFEKYREVLSPFIVEVLKQASKDCPPAAGGAEIEITQSLLLKESAYNAVGLANFDLHHLVDFESWYKGTLSQELRNRHSNGRILRRRIAWLLGQWVNKIEGDVRQQVYSSLVDLLADGDLAVQLAACRSLFGLIDDLHFYEKDFVMFVPTCLECLFQFMSRAQEFDSKLQVLNLVCLIIERLSENILPCTKSLINFLPQVWQDSEGQSILRIQVMVALQRLVCALGPQSPVCYEFLMPILDYSTNIDQPDELNMLEDGLQLWHITLKHAPKITPELMAIFPHLIPVLDRSTEHLEIAMKIIESYVLLAGLGFLQLHSVGVAHILDTVIGNVNEKGMMCSLPVVEMLIQCFPNDAPGLLQMVLQKLLKIVITGDEEADIVRASAGAILARVLVQNPSFFEQWISQPSLISLFGKVIPPEKQNILFAYFDAWMEKVDFLTTFPRKKICVIALCVILTSKEPQVLERLEQILSVCTTLVHQTDESQDGATLGYDYFLPNTHPEDSSRENEEIRKRQMLAADPINTLSVVPLLKEKLQSCSAVHGEAVLNAALSKMHPSLLNQLKQILGT